MRSERLRSATALLVTLLGLGLGSVVSAAPVVAVVRSSAMGPFTRATTAFEDAVHAAVPQAEILTFDLEGDSANADDVMSRVRAGAPAVIVSIGSLATTTVLAAGGEEPLVFSMVLYPKQSGWLGKHRPVTGASLDVPLDLQFRYIRRLLPAARRIGVLYSEEETAAVVTAADAAARSQGLTLVSKAVSAPAEVVDALEGLMANVDVLWSVADGHVFTAQTTSPLILATMRRKMPFVGLSAAHVRTGALAAFSCDYEDVGRQTAELTLRVLKGERASDIPVTAPRVVSLAINLRTADHLGTAIDPALQSEAGEVVR